MQAPRAAKRVSLRRLVTCGLLLSLIIAAVIAAGVVAQGQIVEESSPSTSGALTPLTQFCLIAAWTAYVLAVFFRRPRPNETTQA